MSNNFALVGYVEAAHFQIGFRNTEHIQAPVLFAGLLDARPHFDRGVCVELAADDDFNIPPIECDLDIAHMVSALMIE